MVSLQLALIPDPFNRGRRSVNLASAPLLFGFFLATNTFAAMLFFFFWILAYTLIVDSAIRSILFQLIVPSPVDDLEAFLVLIFEVVSSLSRMCCTHSQYIYLDLMFWLRCFASSSQTSDCAVYLADFALSPHYKPRQQDYEFPLIHIL